MLKSKRLFVSWSSALLNQCPSQIISFSVIRIQEGGMYLKVSHESDNAWTLTQSSSLYNDCSTL